MEYSLIGVTFNSPEDRAMSYVIIPGTAMDLVSTIYEEIFPSIGGPKSL